MSYKKEIEIEFLADGVKVGSGFVVVSEGYFDISNAEDNFYSMIRKNEKSWTEEAQEEAK